MNPLLSRLQDRAAEYNLPLQFARAEDEPAAHGSAGERIRLRMQTSDADISGWMRVASLVDEEGIRILEMNLDNDPTCRVRGVLMRLLIPLMEEMGWVLEMRVEPRGSDRAFLEDFGLRVVDYDRVRYTMRRVPGEPMPGTERSSKPSSRGLHGRRTG